uniref:Uncharacterized protein n=1 Tax=Anopheles minimus TaxID=112268 RepID=A0A182W417_9DIPT
MGGWESVERAVVIPASIPNLRHLRHRTLSGEEVIYGNVKVTDKRDIFSEENRLSPPCRKRAASPSLSIFATPANRERDVSPNTTATTTTPASDGSSCNKAVVIAATAAYSNNGGSSLAAYHRNTALCLRNSGASAKESSTSHQQQQRLFPVGGVRRSQLHHPPAFQAVKSTTVEKEVEEGEVEEEGESSSEEPADGTTTQRPVPLVSRKPSTQPSPPSSPAAPPTPPPPPPPPQGSEVFGGVSQSRKDQQKDAPTVATLAKYDKRRSAIVSSCLRVTEGPSPYIGPRGHVLTNAERKVYPPTPPPPLPPVPTDKPARQQESRESTEEEEDDDTVDNHPARIKDTRKESAAVVGTSGGKAIVREEPNIPGSEQYQRRLRLPSPTPPPAKERVPSPAVPFGAVVRCSVIQRTPAVRKTEPADELTVPATHTQQHRLDDSPRAVDLKVRPMVVLTVEPEQDQPIDYHIPKRQEKDEHEERLVGRRERQAAILHNHMPPYHHRGGSSAARAAAAAAVISGIMQGAAGHGRSSNGGGGGGGGGQSGGGSNAGGAGTGNGGGGGINFSAGGGGGGGGALGAGGAGGGMGGRDGRSNYGPNSPPTGSLPPFYESLKGGGASGGLNGYNANGGFLTNSAASYQQLLSSLECDAQDLGGAGGGPGLGGGVILGLGTGFTYGSATDGSGTGGGGAGGNGQQGNGASAAAAAAAAAAVMGKHCSLMLHNHFGLALKDEVDLGYDSKVDPTLHGLYASATGDSVGGNGAGGGTGGGPGSGGGYDVADSMMDMGDSMQLTATLTTYPSSAGGSPNGLLDGCLSDAEFSLYSRGMHDEQSSNCNDLELTSTPSLTPDSVSASLHQIDSVHDTLADAYPSAGSGADQQQGATSGGGAGGNSHAAHLVLPREYTNMAAATFGAQHGLGGGGHQHTTLHSLASKYHGAAQDGNQPPSYLQTAANGGAYGSFQPLLRYDQLDSNLSLPSPGGGSSLDFDLHQSLQPLQGPFAMNLQLAGAGGQTTHLQQQHPPSSHQRSTGGVRSPGGNSTSSVASSASSAAAVAAVASLTAHNVPVAGPPPAVLATTIQNLGLPADSELQFVNGGHGIKNPLAIENMYVCEECGHTTNEPEVHYMHLKEKHPYSPALLKFYDKRHFKFNNAAFANNLLGSLPMPVHN